ncbi:hypothetical protein D3C72_1750820 [compost metagenome]
MLALRRAGANLRSVSVWLKFRLATPAPNLISDALSVPARTAAKPVSLPILMVAMPARYGSVLFTNSTACVPATPAVTEPPSAMVKVPLACPTAMDIGPALDHSEPAPETVTRPLPPALPITALLLFTTPPARTDRLP